MEFITFPASDESNFVNNISLDSNMIRENILDGYNNILQDKSEPHDDYPSWDEFTDTSYSQISLDPTLIERFDDHSEFSNINSDEDHCSSLRSSVSSTSLSLASKVGSSDCHENTINYSYSYPDLSKHLWNDFPKTTLDSQTRTLGSYELPLLEEDVPLDFLLTLEDPFGSRSGSITMDKTAPPTTISDEGVLNTNFFSNEAVSEMGNKNLIYSDNMNNINKIVSLPVNEANLSYNMYTYFKNSSRSSFEMGDSQTIPLTNTAHEIINQPRIINPNIFGPTPPIQPEETIELQVQMPNFENGTPIEDETQRPSHQTYDAEPITVQGILPRRRSEVRLSKTDLYSRMGLCNNHKEARIRENRIFDILKRTGYDLGTQTWIRDTNEKKRRQIIDLIYRSTFEEYGYKKDLLELIVRRGSYCLTQGRLRRIRRYKKANQMRELAKTGTRSGAKNDRVLNQP